MYTNKLTLFEFDTGLLNKNTLPKPCQKGLMEILISGSNNFSYCSVSRVAYESDTSTYGGMTNDGIIPAQFWIQNNARVENLRLVLFNRDVQREAK